MINYKEIVDFHKNNFNSVKMALEVLEETIIEGRDRLEDRIPIYATKYRIKSVNSIYLKTKRQKISDFKQITDYGGMRILCLAEQDLPKVNEFIIELLKEKKWILSQIKIYNFDLEQTQIFDKQIDNLIIQSNDSKKNFICSRDYKESGYKSIHYILERSNDGMPTVEIQLRTLLQDVWGELEHSLAYKKGQVNPYIKKNFSLLAQDLATCDSLIKHLKEIRDKDNAGRLYSLNKTCPYGYLEYENELLPEIFKDEKKQGEYVQLYQKYSAWVREEGRLDKNRAEWLKSSMTKLDQIIKKVPGEYHDSNDQFIYWKEMEKAYFFFYSGKFNDAIENYEKIYKKFCDRPVLNFRLGELAFIQDRLEDALRYFDLSEKGMVNLNKQGLNKSTVLINKFRIKIKVAFIYWVLGAEYFSIVISNINDALMIYKENQDNKIFKSTDHILIPNLMCWYNLEMYIMLREKKQFIENLIYKYNLTDGEKVKKEKQAKELLNEAIKYYNISKKYFEKLRDKIIPVKLVSANVFDTVAWFGYQTYIGEKEITGLEQAYIYCDHILKNKNGATLLMSSFDKQRSHILDIMNTAHEVGIEHFSTHHKHKLKIYSPPIS